MTLSSLYSYGLTRQMFYNFIVNSISRDKSMVVAQPGRQGLLMKPDRLTQHYGPIPFAESSIISPFLCNWKKNWALSACDMYAFVYLKTKCMWTLHSTYNSMDALGSCVDHSRQIQPSVTVADCRSVEEPDPLLTMPPTTNHKLTMRGGAMVPPTPGNGGRKFSDRASTIPQPKH